MNVLKGKSINILLKVCLSGGLMYLLYRATPLQEILSLMANIDVRYLIPVFILLFANTVLSALKWRQFLLVDGVDIPLAVLTKTYLVGLFAICFYRQVSEAIITEYMILPAEVKKQFGLQPQFSLTVFLVFWQ